MYGTVSEICIQLLKVYENNKKIAVITWTAEDVREIGAEDNPTAADAECVLQAIGEAGCELLCRHGIGRNFVEEELRRLSFPAAGSRAKTLPAGHRPAAGGRADAPPGVRVMRWMSSVCF